MNKTATKELELIRQKAGGFLRPQDVVKYAKNKKTALHKFFEWNDGRAAEKWRIRQAQELIRVVVTINEHTSEKVRTFVSLTTDQKTGLGYRAMVDVMDDNQLMAILIEDAKNDLAIFQRKYEKLQDIAELTGVFVEIQKVTKTKSKPQAKQKEQRAAA